MGIDVETARQTYQIGVSRPPLDIDDLPTPEEVFGVPRVGVKEAFKYAVGPSLIFLGLGVGSGEWLLGPLNVGRMGFVGIGWIILVSAILQVFYNIEISRYVMATGEVPIVGFGRVPPGARFWMPFSLVAVFFAFIWGGWAKSAAAGLFTMFKGSAPAESDAGTVELLAIGTLVAVLLITVLFRRITRGLELVNFGLVGAQLLFLLVVDLLIVPWSVWWDALRGFVTPALPRGGDATLLGALAGFTALASGLNWFALNHYRDKGYAMGHRVGFLSGLRGERQEVRAVGVTFPDDARNAALWRRWMRFLYLDMWGVFFVGAMVGMLLPTILIRQLVLVSGTEPTVASIPTFAAEILSQEYSRALFLPALILGFLILFDTQLGIFELLVRNLTDAANASPRFAGLVAGDPRRFYYPVMVGLIVVVSIVLLFFQPAKLILISANISNLGAMVFPFLVIYLNRRLPRAARPPKWAYVALLANVVFFGFFFVNFVVSQLTGSPLVSF